MLAAIFVVLAVYQLYLNQWLQIRWRRWMTTHYLGEWLHDANHYRMQLQGDAADNPDQRITDDVKLFVERTLDIGLGLLNSVVTLASFVVILWGLSAAAPLHVFGNEFAIPGYLVWGALIYAIFGTALTQWIGSPLVKLDFQQQRFEADFRFNLVRVARKLRADRAVAGRARRTRAAVGALRPRGRKLVRHHEPDQAADRVHPELLAGRGDFPCHSGGAGLFRRQDPARRPEADHGRLRQRARCAVVLRLGLSHAGGMARRRRPSRRLRDVDRERCKARGRSRFDQGRTGGQRRIDLHQLLVRLPNGTPLVSADGFSLRAGERTLVTGPSGAGKSTLFRAIAGIWPFGNGSISIPANASLMMLPQRPYFPIGSLHAAIVYPGETASFSADQVREVLTLVGLPQLAARLDEEAHWNRMLSLGEQQRLGLARALLHRPDYLFLDEATASLDEPSEAALYRLLTEKLPQTTVVSIGHRSTLDAFHQRHIALVRDGDRFEFKEATRAAAP